jgi:hypothetical protein
MTQPDYIEVSRVAHELAAAHAAGAFAYAARRAKEAETSGKQEDYAFWQAVADSLKPR